MSLLDPTPGELFDRLCILELKIRAGDKKGTQVSHWEDERDAIREVLQGVSIPADLGVRLAQIHSLLWDAVDKQMRARSENTRENSDTLLELRLLNWERNHIREEIDKTLNQFRGQEKIA